MNIQNLAQEYEKLMKEEYIFGLANGERIDLVFKKDDFYHLLGFKKFEDVTIVKMIEDKAYFKKNFYDNVLLGHITYDNIEIKIKNISSYMTDGKIINFAEAAETDRTKHALDDRFHYFNYNQVKELLCSELITDYDISKAPKWLKADAEKIFFKLMILQNKNLNLFVKDTASKNRPASFFLEAEKDEYINTDKSCPDKTQKKIPVFYRWIIQKGTIKTKELVIYWNTVRFNNSKSINYKAQIKFFEYYKGTVHSKMVKNDLDIMKSKSEDLLKCIENAERQIKIMDLVQLYNEEKDEDNKLEFAIALLDYELDIEKSPLKYTKEVINKARGELNNNLNQLSNIKNRIKKYEKYLPMLINLEVEEVNSIYKSIMSANYKNYEDEFVIWLIEKVGILNKNIFPEDLNTYYKEYKSDKK